jgi:hypothetical protein
LYGRSSCRPSPSALQPYQQDAGEQRSQRGERAQDRAALGRVPAQHRDEGQLEDAGVHDIAVEGVAYLLLEMMKDLLDLALTTRVAVRTATSSS